MSDNIDDTAELAFIKKRLEKHEGSLEHPYLDTKGLVTIGKGFNVNNKDDFKALPLIYEDDITAPRFATIEEKEAAYDFLKTQTVGKAAEKYEASTKVRLPQAYIDQRIDDEIIERRKSAQKSIGDEAWGKLTIPQRAAAVDLVFNLGSLDGYPDFVQAAKDGDALAMAKETLARTTARKDTDNDHHWARSRNKFCDILGYGPNKCAKAFDAFLNSQTLFRKTTDKDRADGGVYVPPEGVTVNDGELTEDELLRLTGSATATPAADAEDTTSSPAAAPARPATPGATGNTTAQPVPPNQNGPAQNRPNAIDPESDRETAPSPLPGAIPVQPGGRPGNGPVQPGAQPGAIPVQPGGRPGNQSPNPPSGNPPSGNPPSGPQDRDDRGRRSSAIPGPAEWRFGMDHAAQRDNLVAFMAAPEPEDTIPLSQEAQFAVGLHRFIGLPDPKEVNGKKLRMLPPRHDAEGKPITDGLAKASQYVAALADDFGVDRAVRMTQLALNDGLKDGKKPLRVDGDFGPVSKQQLRQTIMDGGYEAFGRAIRRRFGEEYATKART